MKKTIKEFINRLRDAWAVVRGYRCVLISYDKDIKDISVEEMLRSTSVLVGVRWFNDSGDVNARSRTDMLLDLFSYDNSIIMITKDADGRLTYCYDCKTEEDFNDLISMEVE